MIVELRLHTRTKRELVDITSELTAIVSKAGMAEGLCHVYVAHATAAIVINENDDPNICADLIDALARLVPEGEWRHDRIDRNGAAHIKAAMLGPSETIPVCNARLQLGTWQAIMLVDLDGPRQRRVIVSVR